MNLWEGDIWDVAICHKMTDCELEGQEHWNNWKDYNTCEDFVDGILADWNSVKFGALSPEEFIALINKTMEEEDLDWEQMTKKFVTSP